MTDATRLWVNVVLQATQDALKDKHERQWFALSNPDFIEVCSLADLDPEAVVDRATDAFRRYDRAEATGTKFKVAVEPRGPKPKLRRYEHDGKSLTVPEWSRLTGISEGTIRHRLMTHPVANALDPNFKRRARSFNKLPRRRAKPHTIDGTSKTLAHWAEEHGISYRTLTRRLRLGMPLEHALSQAARNYGRAKVHTINGLSRTHAEWAEHLGITSGALQQRISHGRTMAEAVAMGGLQRRMTPRPANRETERSQ